MKYTVFISHSSSDKAVADNACDFLSSGCGRGVILEQMPHEGDPFHREEDLAQTKMPSHGPMMHPTRCGQEQWESKDPRCCTIRLLARRPGKT